MLISKIRKKTHYIIWGFAIIFFVSIFYLYGMDVFGGGSKQLGRDRQKSRVPDVMLKIDGKEVKMNEFFYKYLQLKQRYEAMSGESFNTYPMQMFLRSQTADMIINQQIMLDEARKRNIRVSSGELNQRIDQIQQSYLGPDENAGDAGIIGKTKDFFSTQERRKQFKDIIARQGITYDFFRNQVRNDLLQEKVSAEIGEEMLVEEKKKALEKAKNVLNKLEAGEPFENVAREFSDDESTKENGGRLGWTSRGTLTPAYEQAAFALNRGQISQPVETEFGYHIIQLIDKKEAVGPEFEAERPAIIDSIQERKGDETYNPTPQEIKNEYEEVNTRHILIRYRDRQQLAGEWVQRERQKDTRKIEIINPELKAYRYLNQPMLQQQASADVDYDRAMDLYQEAKDVDPNNPYIYYQIGRIYEMKNRKAQYDKLMASLEDEQEDDPYAEAMADMDTATDTDEVEFDLDDNEATATAATAAVETGEENAGAEEADDGDDVADKFLPEALEMYQKALDIAEEDYRYDAVFYLAVADVASDLGKTEYAIENYAEAMDFSVGNIDYLNRVRDGIEKYAEESERAGKILAETQEYIDDLEAEEDYYPEGEEGMGFDMGEEEFIGGEVEVEGGAEEEETSAETGEDAETDDGQEAPQEEPSAEEDSPQS